MAVRLMVTEKQSLEYLENMPILDFMDLVEEIIEIKKEQMEHTKQ